MLLGFFLFETFTEDVSPLILQVSAFQTTLRRALLDVAAKIVTRAVRTILKHTDVVMETLRFQELRDRCLPDP